MEYLHLALTVVSKVGQSVRANNLYLDGASDLILFFVIPFLERIVRKSF